MAIQSESELYQPVKRFLAALGYEVKGEVQHCDVVAARAGENPLIVELKKNFNLQLVLQGVERLKLSDRVYVAVEEPGKSGRKASRREWSQIVKLCRMLGLGLLTVRFASSGEAAVSVHCEPGPYSTKQIKKKTKGLLSEFHERSGDYNPGGISARKLVTVYREQALRCAYLLHQQGETSPKKLKLLTGVEKTPSILQRNVYGWFQRIERGSYALTEAGKRALNEYEEVLAQLFKA